MVLDLSFSQNICTKCKCFVKKHRIFRPAGGGIACQVNDGVSRMIEWFRPIVEIVNRQLTEQVAGDESGAHRFGDGVRGCLPG